MPDPRAGPSAASDSGNDKKKAVAPALLIIENTQYFNELFELLAVEEIDREQVMHYCLRGFTVNSHDCNACLKNQLLACRRFGKF